MQYHFQRDASDSILIKCHDQKQYHLMLSNLINISTSTVDEVESIDLDVFKWFWPAAKSFWYHKF